MGWFDGEDGEKLKNLMMFKFYGTDKELADAGPAFLVILLVVITLIGLGLWIFG